MPRGISPDDQAAMLRELLAENSAQHNPGNGNSQHTYHCPWCHLPFRNSIKCVQHARVCPRNPKNKPKK